MALSSTGQRSDRRFGYVLIAVFAFGVLGGALAAIRNGVAVPESHATILHLTTTAAPL